MSGHLHLNRHAADQRLQQSPGKSQAGLQSKQNPAISGPTRQAHLSSQQLQCATSTVPQEGQHGVLQAALKPAKQ